MVKLTMEVRRISLNATEKANWLSFLDPEGGHTPEQFEDDIPELSVVYGYEDYQTVKTALTLYSRMNPKSKKHLNFEELLPAIDRDSAATYQTEVPPDSSIFLAMEWVLLNYSPVMNHVHDQLSSQFGRADAAKRVERDIMPRLFHMAGILNLVDEAVRPVVFSVS